MKQAIINLLAKLSCMHDYKLNIHVKHLIEDKLRWNTYYYICKKCGKFKKIDTRD